MAEARGFLDDKATDKRRALVERLLSGPGYANHFTDLWRKVLLPNLDDDFRLKYFAPGFDTLDAPEVRRERPLMTRWSGRS